MERRAPLWLFAAVLAAAPAFAEPAPPAGDAPPDIEEAEEKPCAKAGQAAQPKPADGRAAPAPSDPDAPELPPCPQDDTLNPALPADGGARDRRRPASPEEEKARAEQALRSKTRAADVAGRGAAILRGMAPQPGAALPPGAAASPQPAGAAAGTPARPDLKIQNATPAAQSAYNSLKTNAVPLAAPRAAPAAAKPGKLSGDAAHQAWAEAYFDDPRMQKAVRQVMDKAEKMVADPNYKNSTYGWVYKLASHRAKVAMAANDVMMGYRYGGSEAQFPKDFGGDLKAGEVADLDHFFAGGVYGAIPVLGPMVCSGLSVAYDGVVSPAQKKFKNYAYDLKQVKTDMKGCSYALTMEAPGRAF